MLEMVQRYIIKMVEKLFHGRLKGLDVVTTFKKHSEALLWMFYFEEFMAVKGSGICKHK